MLPVVDVSFPSTCRRRHRCDVSSPCTPECAHRSCSGLLGRASSPPCRTDGSRAKHLPATSTTSTSSRGKASGTTPAMSITGKRLPGLAGAGFEVGDAVARLGHLEQTSCRLLLGTRPGVCRINTRHLPLARYVLVLHSKVYQEEKAKLQITKARASLESGSQRGGLKRTGAETKVPSPLGLSSSKASVSKSGTGD